MNRYQKFEKLMTTVDNTGSWGWYNKAGFRTGGIMGDYTTVNNPARTRDPTPPPMTTSTRSSPGT